MATQLKPEIKNVTQTARLNLTGPPSYFMRVLYVVGTHGPFTAEFPAAEFTAQAVQAEMAKTAATINALGFARGREGGGVGCSGTRSRVQTLFGAP